MADLNFRGNREDLINRLRQIPGVLSGRIADPTGLMPNVLESVGLSVLSHVHDNYNVKSQGGVDDMGIQWPALAQVTLALRRKNTSAKAIAQIKGQFPALPEKRKQLIAVQYERLLRLYTADRRNDRPSAASRKYARRLTELMKPYISKTRYETLKKQLAKDLPTKMAEKLAYIGAFARILYDTGRLLGSLSAQIASPDRILRVGPGAVTVGSNVQTKSGINLLSLHNSAKPRKKKKDGTDRLPRRQVLPDLEHPMPDLWKRDIRDTLGRGIRGSAFMQRLLGS